MKGIIKEKQVELNRLKTEGLELSQELQASKTELISIKQDIRTISRSISILRTEIKRLKNNSRGSKLRKKGRAPILKLGRHAYSDLVDALTLFRWGVLDRQLSASCSAKQLRSMCRKIKCSTQCLKI